MQSGEWSDHPPTLVVHPTVEARKEIGDGPINVTVNGGYRHEVETEEYESSGDLWHATGDLTVPIRGPHSVELKMEVRRHMLEVTEGHDYWVTLVSLGYDLSGLLGVAAVHEYSDQTEGSEAQIAGWTLPFPRKHYVWGMATVHAPAPLDGLDLRLIGGTQRGGIKCAGGVCRNYPDSVGARVEAVYRF